MKKFIYIALCGVLGIFLSTILHALLEILIIRLVLLDFDKYSLGLDWPEILLVHLVFTVVLALAGFFFGVWLGFKWWRKVYLKTL